MKRETVGLIKQLYEPTRILRIPQRAHVEGRYQAG
jgi:hypothetical protein